MPDQPLELGFVGLGAMGLPMASNLISKAAKGSTLHVYDISESSMAALAKAHPEVVFTCGSPREVSRKSVSCRHSTLSIKIKSWPIQTAYVAGDIFVVT